MIVIFFFKELILRLGLRDRIYISYADVIPHVLVMLVLSTEYFRNNAYWVNAQDLCLAHPCRM